MSYVLHFKFWSALHRAYHVTEKALELGCDIRVLMNHELNDLVLYNSSRRLSRVILLYL